MIVARLSARLLVILARRLAILLEILARLLARLPIGTCQTADYWPGPLARLSATNYWCRLRAIVAPPHGPPKSRGSLLVSFTGKFTNILGIISKCTNILVNLLAS